LISGPHAGAAKRESWLGHIDFLQGDVDPRFPHFGLKHPAIATLERGFIESR
jgi:hypothetical protein